MANLKNYLSAKTVIQQYIRHAWIIVKSLLQGHVTLHGNALSAGPAMFVMTQEMEILCYFAMPVIKVTIWNAMFLMWSKNQKESGCVANVYLKVGIL